VSHNIEKDVYFIKKSCPLLVQILFFGLNQSLKQWNLLVQVLLFVDLLKPYMLFVRRVQIRAPRIWDIKVDFPSTEGFDVFIMSPMHLSNKWVGISMLFSGGRTNPTHWANRAFTHGYALEHIVTLKAHYHHIDSPNGRTVYPCSMKWHCCKTCIPLYLVYFVASNTMDSTCFIFLPLKKHEGIGLINRIKVFNNRIGFHLQGYHWN
jgi:hypothetical protein